MTRRADIALLIAALAAGTLFFTSLDRIWPLADLDVNAAPEDLIPKARVFLGDRGIDVGTATAASALRVDAFALDYSVRSLGIAATQEMIRDGDPLYHYEVLFKKRGDPDAYWADVHPERGVIGWGRTLQEDAPGRSLEAEDARRLAWRAVGGGVPANGDVRDVRDERDVRDTTLSPTSPTSPIIRDLALAEKGHTERDRPHRRDHTFVFERFISKTPELRERVSVVVAGDAISSVQRALVPPESARREARRREAPVAALQMSSFILLGILGIAAIVIFLTRLGSGDVRLRPAAQWVAIIAVFYAITQALRPHMLLRQWDPLWPRVVATLETLGFSMSQGAWIALALFVVLAAGDAIDRGTGANRGSAFWRAGRGRLLDRDVGFASLHGFLVGLICGGAMVTTLLLLEAVAGSWVSLQPQGFFFFAINSQLPALSTLLYFFMVAIVEECAYRYFAGTWLLSVTGKKWIAIIIPGLLYGASHTGLDFLPPVEPFWGRALALTVVGCVWGWAFFRFDALTVILSHFTADLFIFNWPRLGSGDPVLMAKAIATMSVPLIPALFLLFVRHEARGMRYGA